MSTKWSYSGDPSASSLDQVRFLIGDVDPKDPLLTDAEVMFTVNQEGSLNEAAISCVQAIVAKTAKLVTTLSQEATDKEQKALSDRLGHYKDLAVQLRLKRGRRLSGISAGGLSVSGKCAADQNTDRVRPAFTTDLQESPGLADPTFRGN